MTTLTKGILLWMGLVVGVCLGAGNAWGAVKVENVRSWSAPDHTRLVFDLTEEPVFKTDLKDGVLTIYMPGVQCGPSLSSPLAISHRGVKEVTFTPDQIAISLDRTKEIKVFKLPPVADKLHRLVVDIYLPVEGQQDEEAPAKPPSKTKAPLKVIVLDPGHGGDDPGALGPQGTREKDVVLSVARKACEQINQKRGFRAFLTRNGDYYVPFRKRVKIARDRGAQLFISIHADAEPSRTARGASVYVLSLRGASSEAARILARKENLADIIGGTMMSEAMADDEAEPILLNMVQTDTINASRYFGTALIGYLQSCHRIKFPQVQEAPFMVLKLPEIPSVLIELGYISQPREERLLRHERFQDMLATAIADTAQAYLEGKRVVPKGKVTLADWTEIEEPPPKVKPITTYRVQKGDSLARIAKKFGVSAAEIMAANNFRGKQAKLYVGKVLKIPRKGEEKKGSSVAKGKVKEKAGRPSKRFPIKWPRGKHGSPLPTVVTCQKRHFGR